jgi:hypothetical protein
VIVVELNFILESSFNNTGDAYNLHRTPELKSLLTDYKKRYHLAIRDTKIEANAKFISDNKTIPEFYGTLSTIIEHQRTNTTIVR